MRAAGGRVLCGRARPPVGKENGPGLSPSCRVGRHLPVLPEWLGELGQVPMAYTHSPHTLQSGPSSFFSLASAEPGDLSPPLWVSPVWAQSGTAAGRGVAGFVFEGVRSADCAP